jgi:type IV pilus assembly protein PilO
MALPKISELSIGLQILLILLVGAALWAASEFLLLHPLSDSIAKKQADADKLTKEVVPLRPYEQKQKQLIAENQQLEMQLANLRQIVPDEKEVDNFIRLVEGAAVTSGIDVRRFTAKTTVPQDYYVEVPFEVELDGPYFQLLSFFDRLGKLARIVNVSDLKMGSLQGGKAIGNKAYAYAPNETAVGICNIITFFSREEALPLPAKPGKPAAKPPGK